MCQWEWGCDALAVYQYVCAAYLSTKMRNIVAGGRSLIHTGNAIVFYVSAECRAHSFVSFRIIHFQFKLIFSTHLFFFLLTTISIQPTSRSLNCYFAFVIFSCHCCQQFVLKLHLRYSFRGRKKNCRKSAREREWTRWKKIEK